MSEFEPGDILACFGKDRASRIITWGTAHPLAPRRLKLAPSHVAMIAGCGTPLWIESTTMCSHDCLVRMKPCSGVQVHRPEERIGDYLQSGGRTDLYRLVPSWRLDKSECELLERMLLDFATRAIGYDMGGALLSGTRLLKWSRWMPGADLEQLFCSEMIAAALMRCHRLPQDNPTRYSPALLMRRLVKLGVYEHHKTYS